MDKVALKIQRRRFTRDAVEEIDIHDQIRGETGSCREIIALREAFVHDEHVCMAFDKHGCSLESALERGPLSISRVRRVTRQMLLALHQMHQCGYVHTDVKPDNILYDGRTGVARLADLGSASNRLRQGSRRGTREYMAPEILVGAPLGAALDLWSLGCTIFEMLTGRLLFCPRTAAARKYREFSEGPDGIDLPCSERAIKDEDEEAAEQFSRGAIIAGRYKLERVLGQGHFGTVWTAQQIAARSLDCSRDALRAYAENVEDASGRKGERTPEERAWCREKGASDLLDLALNYEHTVLMAALCGLFPLKLTQEARYRTSYFESDGELRFRPPVHRMSLRERLRRQGHLSGDNLELVTDFLRQLLRITPEERPTAETALRHAWLASGVKS